MRITNQMIVQRQLAGLETNIGAIDKAQTQVSSGKRLTAASDDPVAAVQIMSATSLLQAIGQYQSNVSRAADRINTEDSVVQQLSDVLTRAQAIAVQQASSTATPETRAGAQAEVQGLLDSAIQLGNTKFGNEFLFGGDNTTTPPFARVSSGGTVNFTSNAPSGERRIAIGDGQTMAVTHDGSEVFLSTGALSSLRDLAASLANNDVAGINTAATGVNSAFDAVQGIVGEVGARGNQLDMTKSNLATYQASITSTKSDLEDVDTATAITELTTRQTAYQAALLAVSKTTGLTLTDYLK